ncbi:N-acetylmannosamine-6-phosphate 2-epimerase [Erysipelothrix larvae]|uniref:Putative N-acetylmannosamine-6-phosphate 2-epimerase n=1 Tax=Erysipelothrix larvae TaxID=1514105 RepID=A0A0X8GZB1_9FIRM|nr:N-acetylmannosamine-6-phosphate 2-epimerase [Erysipelothrix larvae]AMC93204.1 N-acetylmannosamine-6-phosphate 2-epimerase [Erysipelothrix larvae]
MLNEIKGKLVVSCQALENEPLHSAMIMGRMAIAAKNAGACGIRAQGVEDILEIKRVTGLPVIGIIKKDYPDSEVYITATQKEVQALIDAGCDMIALDATKRVRPNGELTEDLLALIKKANIESMADISTLDEAIAAEKMGFDCVSTTLAGYTPYSTNVEGPNIQLIQQILQNVTIPVIAEGKIHEPKQLKAVMDLGVHSAVVGGAITRPQEIAARFIKELKQGE